MDTIIIKIKCDPKYQLLNRLREQGMLFDTVRQSLDIDYEGVQEISDKEYEMLENYKNDKI